MSAHDQRIQRFEIPALMNFVEEGTKHRFTHFWADIDVIRPENLMEFVLMEKSEG